MEFNGGRTSSNSCNSSAITQSSDEEMELRRGPWTVDEDLLLMNYIASHGEGRWNSLARCAGLKRTGKSCRLRWLNYLRPDVRRGNITLEEQLMILELHSRWGNRWSKIAQHLPGRTDNEIKNYWRTRVQKHAKQLQCDVNSKQFKDTMKYLWMPRLVERIQAASASASSVSHVDNRNQSSFNGSSPSCHEDHAQTNNNTNNFGIEEASSDCSQVSDYNSSATTTTATANAVNANLLVNDSNYNMYNTQNAHYNYPDTLISPTGYFINQGGFELQQSNGMWLGGGDGGVAEGISDNLWNVDDEDMWF